MGATFAFAYPCLPQPVDFPMSFKLVLMKLVLMKSVSRRRLVFDIANALCYSAQAAH